MARKNRKHLTTTFGVVKELMLQEHIGIININGDIIRQVDEEAYWSAIARAEDLNDEIYGWYLTGLTDWIAEWYQKRFPTLIIVYSEELDTYILCDNYYGMSGHLQPIECVLEPDTIDSYFGKIMIASAKEFKEKGQTKSSNWQKWDGLAKDYNID